MEGRNKLLLAFLLSQHRFETSCTKLLMRCATRLCSSTAHGASSSCRYIAQRGSTLNAKVWSQSVRMKRKTRATVEQPEEPQKPQKAGPNPPGIDYRSQPEKYKIARGEQGVLTVEPYKGEILPHWRFRDPAVAEESAAKIYGLYEDYKKQKDFVGMDMSRKFLQMGYTRAMRYANHKGGRKYDKITHELLPKSVDPVKIESAQKFHPIWKQVEADPDYQTAKAQHLELEKLQKESTKT